MAVVRNDKTEGKHASMAQKTVMVCGYFDGLHPGHIQFLKKASQHGRLVVGVGSDERLRQIKGSFALFNQQERLAMVEACRYVHKVILLPKVEGNGGVVWEQELIREKPDFFYVNDDIDSKWLEFQREICTRHSVKFLVSNRDRPAGWQPTSSTEMRERLYPYRVCLTTGMDQMQLSRLAKGPCIGFSIEPTERFDDRCGMATSTRKSLIQAYGGRGLPVHLAPEELARIAFALDNPPKFPTSVNSTFPYGSYAPRYITGSVDPITTLIPGVSLCEYDGHPWPKITTITDPVTMDWLEQVVTLVATQPRPPGEHYQLTPDQELVNRFSAASYSIWDAVNKRDLPLLKKAVDQACDRFSHICDTYLGNGMQAACAQLRAQNVSTFVQGAGHGGYIACIAEDPQDRIRIKIRRPA